MLFSPSIEIHKGSLSIYHHLSQDDAETFEFETHELNFIL